VLKKPSRNKDAVKDVPADNPVGTMDRFTAGLKRILSAERPAKKRRRKRASP
jgi:hypothetical protein